MKQHDIKLMKFIVTWYILFTIVHEDMYKYTSLRIIVLIIIIIVLIFLFCT
jgi:hypothetical protein